MCIKYQGWTQQHMGHTNITMHTNTQSDKQDRPRAQEKKKNGPNAQYKTMRGLRPK